LKRPQSTATKLRSLESVYWDVREKMTNTAFLAIPNATFREIPAILMKRIFLANEAIILPYFS
jgi:hypothetical protein